MRIVRDLPTYHEQVHESMASVHYDEVVALRRRIKELEHERSKSLEKTDKEVDNKGRKED